MTQHETQLTLLTLHSQNGTIHPVLLRSREHLLLVDTGYPGQLDRLEAALRDVGVSFRDLTGVILTHQDIDHIGGAAGLKQQYPHIKLYAHILEAPYITGQKTPVKVAAMEAALPAMTEDQAAFYHSYRQAFDACRVGIDALLTDGSVIDEDLGLKVIHTPGHTPGHICLLVQGLKTLIAGDALNIREGRLQGADPQLSQDMPAAKASLSKLLLPDLEQVICYHGGILTEDIEVQMQNLVKQ